MAKPLSELAPRLGAIAVGIGKVSDKALVACGNEIKKAVQAEMHGVTRLRGVGRHGARVGVRVDAMGTGDNAVVRVRATGPFQLIERDTRAHDIEPRRKQALFFGGSFSMYSHSKGTKGKGPWKKGTEAAKPLVKKTYEEATWREVVSALKG